MDQGEAAALNAVTEEFWNSTSAFGKGFCSKGEHVGCSRKGTSGMSFPPKFQTRVPRIFNYTQCTELSGYNYWSGVPEDDQMRKLASQAINYVTLKPKLARKCDSSEATGAKRPAKCTTSENVIGYTSMEAVAWMTVLMNHNIKVRRWNQRIGMQNFTNYQFPLKELDFTNVRGMSDYDHPPLCWDEPYDSQRLTQCYVASEWHRRMRMPRGKTEMTWECAGYKFAGEMAANVVLRLLEDEGAASDLPAWMSPL
jgi:hypothetical protein